MSGRNRQRSVDGAEEYLHSCTMDAEVSNAGDAALANAPVDDEPVTDAEAIAIEEGERDVEAGRVVTADEVQVRLGL